MSRRKMYVLNFTEQLIKPEIENRVRNKDVTKIFSTRNAIGAIYRESWGVRGAADETVEERDSTSRTKAKGNCYLCVYKASANQKILHPLQKARVCR